MNIAFLDIDGVLNSHIWFAARKGPPTYQSMFEKSIWDLDPSAVALMKDFVQRNSLKVVISSTWRKLYNEQEIKALFEKRDWNIPVVGMTPSLKGFRGDEIQAWIRDWNKQHPSDPVDKYVIFDDDSDVNNDQKPYLIQTKFDSGLTKLHIQRAEQVLNQSQ